MDNLFGGFFYHIYPFGFCGVPEHNGFACPAGDGLRRIAGHIPRLAGLGVNGVYIGPLFESTSHGYDTVDYFHVDRRLGNNADLTRLAAAFHEAGIKVVLDGVFNHTGRDFFAFKDIQEKKYASQYTDWYVGLDFSRRSPCGDDFAYEGWAGHYNLAKLRGDSPGVREHLFSAVKYWIDEFAIDGLRLDAANVLSRSFMEELSRRCKAQKPGFWLMGETVAGDYRELACEGCLDSVTNYELYKGLWSCFNDRNMFEIAWTLNRQSAPGQLYPHLALYNFADNHDTNRVASMLKNKAHLFPLYGLLFTMPGIPSLYYGSEYGIEAQRDDWSDRSLRPAWDEGWAKRPGAADLLNAIRQFAAIRRASLALERGSYRELLVAAEQFSFLREWAGERVAVVVNGAEQTAGVTLGLEKLGTTPGRLWRDLLSGEAFNLGEAGLTVPLWPTWIRVLREG